MVELIKILIGDVNASAFEQFDAFVKMVLENTLYVEKMLDNVLNSQAVSTLYTFMYGFACMLIVLKFLQRGFSIYILWRDGDPDTSPKDALMGLIIGMALMATFPILYGYLTEVVLWLYQNILNILKLSELSLMVNNLLNAVAGNLFFGIIALIYAVAGFVLWLQTIKRGLELLILRIGFPIACVGLINSDGGIFRGYLNTIIKTTLTLMLQAILISVSYKLVSSFNMNGLLLGIAALMSAYSVPALFQSFLISGSGPNVGQKVTSTARVIQSVKGLIR